MSRPEHLSCVNTAEGIRRINEEQRHYDEDPDGYERREQEAQEQEQMYQEQMRQYENEEHDLVHQ